MLKFQQKVAEKLNKRNKSIPSIFHTSLAIFHRYANLINKNRCWHNPFHSVRLLYYYHHYWSVSDSFIIKFSIELFDVLYHFTSEINVVIMYAYYVLYLCQVLWNKQTYKYKENKEREKTNKINVSSRRAIIFLIKGTLRHYYFYY